MGMCASFYIMPPAAVPCAPGALALFYYTFEQFYSKTCFCPVLQCVICGKMISTDLVTRGLRSPYTPVTILGADDKPDDTVLLWLRLGCARFRVPCTRGCALQRLS